MTDDRYESFQKNNDNISKKRQPWPNQKLFLEKLSSVESKSDKLSFKRDEKENCQICGKKNVKTGIFKLYNINWEDSLRHYILKHNFKPSDEFIDIIFSYMHEPLRDLEIIEDSGLKFVRKSNNIVKIDRKQMKMIGNLLERNGKTGLLDFNDIKLEHVLVSFASMEKEIKFPGEVVGLYDYECLFHVHPKINSDYEIIYKIPTYGDILYFIDNYNNGNIQHSIIISPEGLYDIFPLQPFKKNLIIVDEEEIYTELTDTMKKIDIESIIKYGKDFDKSTFYNVIANDTTFINLLNEVLNKYRIHIEYHPRIKSGNEWIIDNLYLKIYPTELKHT